MMVSMSTTRSIAAPATVSMVLPSALGPLRLVASREGLCGVYFPNHRGEPVELAGPAVRAKASSSSCLLYTSPSPRDGLLSRMPSSA